MNRKSAPGRWPSPGTHPARGANLCGGAGHLAQRTLDAMLCRQGVEMHRHGSDQRDAVLVSGAGHRRRRPQHLERPGHQTGDLSAGRNHGAGLRLGPSFPGNGLFRPPNRKPAEIRSRPAGLALTSGRAGTAPATRPAQPSRSGRARAGESPAHPTAAAPPSTRHHHRTFRRMPGWRACPGG